MTPQHDVAQVARGVIDANSYMIIATADRAGQPWPSPVWYAHAGYREFLWVSSPATRHSRNLAERPGAGIVIFDSHVPAGNAQAVYLIVTAEEVPADQLPGAIDVYSARSQAMGLSRWTPDEVRAPAPHRLYRAIATELFVIDGFDQRIPVEIS
jgi:pyridoxamine 5'-phosphate oxidase-like protein